MKNFHICYYKDQNLPLLSGWNVEAKTIEIALRLFKKEFSNYEIYYIQNKSTNSNELRSEACFTERYWKSNFSLDVKKIKL